MRKVAKVSEKLLRRYKKKIDALPRKCDLIAEDVARKMLQDPH